MGFYKLEKKDYKKVSKEFRNTYIGWKLYLIFDWFRSLLILFISLSFVIGFLNGITDKELSDTENIMESISDISTWVCVIAALISYYVYLKHLKLYFETKKIKK